MNVTLTTLTSLEALVLKATHESLPCPDSAAVDAFCSVMRYALEGPLLATQVIAARIHSSNAREALLALTMLDSCMRRCEVFFQEEVGKFRFLNEMIKLVSPKYFADRTAPEVQTRVLQLLHAWSIEYPNETKFKVAYDMLKNQGVVKETPPPLPPEGIPTASRARAKNAIFEDEEKSKLLQKLLQSKKPEDLQHANRLIKTMVREEERRNEASSRRAQEVTAALDSAGLLQDMLEHASEASQDEEQLIHELHASCARLKPVLQKLAAAEQQDSALEEVIHASTVIDNVFDKYKIFVSERKYKSRSPGITQVSNGGDSLLDFAGSIINNKAKKDGAKVVESKKSTIDELGDIFSTETDNSGNIAEPLKPVSLLPNDDVDLLEDKNSKYEGWNGLDSLGEQLLKQSLPENARRLDGFNGKTTKKIPMNALEKKSSPHTETPATMNNGAMFDLDFLTKKPDEEQNSIQLPSTASTHTLSNDDLMVDITIQKTNNSSEKILDLNPLDVPSSNTLTKLETTEVKPESGTSKITKANDIKLADINVTLDSVKPSKLLPMKVFEEDGGLSVVLHFCKDKPRSDVYVLVVSTTSKNTSPIEDYKFQAVVSKGCKVRLLTPSGTSLPAYNPFLPPPATTQVLLLGRPPSSPAVTLTYVITYTCEDDTCSEMGELKNLPLDDI